MLTGEMTAALSRNTILKDAVRLGECKNDTEYLLKGYRYARKNGLNEALFKTRILKNLFGATPDQTYSFFCGAVLTGEADRILAMSAKKIYVAGRAEIKEQLTAILNESKDIEVIAINEKTAAEATVRGILKIYEYEG
jgi:2-keto-3-deoxy-galactonokinase